MVSLTLIASNLVIVVTKETFHFSPDTAKLNIITQQWREGQLTNWEYLTALNLISGRTYQDLMQYPVFPWVLSDYESSTLDLNAIENFRNFSKPIAIQHSDNEEHYVNSYNVRTSPLSSHHNCLIEN